MSSLIDSNGFLQMPQTQYVEDQNLNKMYNTLNERVGRMFMMDPGPEYHEATRQLENQIKEGGGNPYGYFSQSGYDLSDQEKTQAAQGFNMTNALMGGNSGGGGGFGSPFGNVGGRLSMMQPRMQQGGREQPQMNEPAPEQVARYNQPPIVSDPVGMYGNQNQGPITAGNNPYESGNNGAGAYAGAAIGGLLSGNLGGALQAAGGYYAGQKGIEGAYQTGVAGLDMAEQMGQRASDASQFKPYGVTSNLANVQTDASGGMNVGLNQQQQRMQNQLMSGAQQQFGNVNAIDPSIAAQRGAMGGMFGQQLSQQGQPTGMEGITQAGLGGAMSQFGAAGQPSDLNQLRGQFAGQVGGYLNQQPNQQIGMLGQQALGLGAEGLSNLSAPSDMESLRSQYANLAGQAGQGLLTSPEQAQNSIYESIRATQRPEEERQNLRLQEQLAAQGRSGVRTADYGGTPEQLAMAKAQAEAQNTAALQARSMGMQEQAQGLQRAQTLTGLASGLAGTSSDLQSAAQSRSSQLSQLGLSAEQIQSQLQSEGLSRGVTAGSTASQLAGMGSDLETAGIGRGATLAGVGMQGAQTGQGFDQQNLQNLMALQGADQGAAAAQQALQQGRLGLGTGMLGAGYQPQQQAMALAQLGLQGGQLAQRGQLSGAELQSQMGGRGLESYMQGGNMANLLQQQQLQGMMGSMFGNQPTAMEQALMALSGGKFQGTNGMMGSLGVGEGKTPEFIKAIGDYFGFGGKNNPLGSPLGNSSDNAVAQYILDQGNSQQSDSSKSKLDAFNDLVLGGG